MPSTVDREKRLGLQLPLEVSGSDAAGHPFSEATRTVNISGGGICFESTRHILVGTRLRLQIRLPASLQQRFGGRDLYTVRAVVCREENFDGQSLHRIGARFLGEAEEEAAPPRR